MTESQPYKTALIIGGSGGIGRAIAATLIGAGLRLALLGRNEEALDRARAELGADAANVLLLPCDATDRPRLNRAVEHSQAELGGIDVLVCAAGLNVRHRSLRSLEPDDWDRVIAGTLTTAFNAIHAVLPAMRTKGNGLIVQVSSLAGLRASAIAGAAYSAAKFGQSALGITVGREERGRGIRSTVIYAGEVDTGLLDARAGRPGAIDDQGRRQRLLQPADVAAAVRFLVDLPARAHVPELVIKPTIDDFA